MMFKASRRRTGLPWPPLVLSGLAVLALCWFLLPRHLFFHESGDPTAPARPSPPVRPYAQNPSVPRLPPAAAAQSSSAQKLAEHIRSHTELAPMSDLDPALLPPALRRVLQSSANISDVSVVRVSRASVVMHLAEVQESGHQEHTARVYVRALGTLHFDGRLRPGFYLISYWDFFDRRLGWPVLANSCKHHVAASRDVVLIPDFEVLADMGFGKWFGQVDAARSTWGWKDKLPVVFWRGSSTGQGGTSTPRSRFLDYARAHPARVNAGFTAHAQPTASDASRAFVKKYPLVKPVPVSDSQRYRYLIVLDGNGAAYSRLAWILYSSSLCLKHEGEYSQWYYPRLQPGVHFLSIDADFGNLEAQVDWAETHPEQVQTIIANANRFARETFDGQRLLADLAAALDTYQEVLAERRLLGPSAA